MAFLLLVLAVLVVSGWGVGASRLTAGPRAREPSLRSRLSRPFRALPAGAGASSLYTKMTALVRYPFSVDHRTRIPKVDPDLCHSSCPKFPNILMNSTLEAGSDATPCD